MTSFYSYDKKDIYVNFFLRVIQVYIMHNYYYLFSFGLYFLIKSASFPSSFSFSFASSWNLYIHRLYYVRVCVYMCVCGVRVQCMVCGCVLDTALKELKYVILYE